MADLQKLSRNEVRPCDVHFECHSCFLCKLLLDDPGCTVSGSSVAFCGRFQFQPVVLRCPFSDSSCLYVDIQGRMGNLCQRQTCNQCNGSSVILDILAIGQNGRWLRHLRTSCTTAVAASASKLSGAPSCTDFAALAPETYQLSQQTSPHTPLLAFKLRSYASANMMLINDNGPPESNCVPLHRHFLGSVIVTRSIHQNLCINACCPCTFKNKGTASIEGSS